MTLQKFNSKEMISLIKEKYIPLIALFVSKQITVQQFETDYSQLFISGLPGCGYDTFEVLEAVFGDLKAWYPTPDPALWPAEIGEQELYKNCQENLETLKQIVERA